MQSAGFTVDITAKIKGYQEEIEKIKKELSQVGENSDIGKGLVKTLQYVERQVATLSKSLTRRITSESSLNKLNDSFVDIESNLKKIGQEMQKVSWDDLKPDELVQSFNEATSSLKQLQSQVDATTKKTFEDLLAKSKDIQTTFKELKIDPSKMGIDEMRQRFHNAINENKKDIKSLSDSLDAAKQKVTDLDTRANNLKNDAAKRTGVTALKADLDKMFTPQQQVETLNTDRIKEFVAQVKTHFSHIQDASSDLKNRVNGDLKTISSAKNVQELSAALVDLNNAYKENKLGSAAKAGGFANITQALARLGETIPQTKFDLNALTEQLRTFFQTYQGFGLTDVEQSNIIERLLDPNASVESIEKVKKIVIEAIQNYLADVDKAINQTETESKAASKLVDSAEVKLKAAQDRDSVLKSTRDQTNAAYKALQQQLADANARIADLEKQVEALKSQIDNRRAAGANAVQKAGQGIESDAAEKLKESEKAAAKYAQQLRNVEEAERAVGNINNFIQRWFSATAAINLVKRAFDSIKTTVRELDDVMTEIAIVTDKTQADLWGQMSSYTAMAKEYAVSIKGVYQVSQLFYQQGLQTADVMALSEETLKMAKISSLDYADATNYMTNAIRSFKMEATDASRVVDVYSAIAAASATDTAELAVAMSKTASAAESVGSSFENTTAMMAVMIEATRESATNIGSAMKSIISRYGEMTADPSAITDSEGEQLSLNRVDKALQTVGISIHDAAGQFREFDDVIMELADAWDSIDKNTQRYIATIMAGNRQQSRFLALVSNGKRLKELSEDAANSQEAATLQVLKTMDSISAKTQQLQTNLQSLYTEGGFEFLYKKILDFANNILSTFNSMPKLFGKIPAVAIATFASLFTRLRQIFTNSLSDLGGTLKTIKEHLKNPIAAGGKEGFEEVRKEVDKIVSYIQQQAAPVSAAVSSMITGEPVSNSILNGPLEGNSNIANIVTKNIKGSKSRKRQLAKAQAMLGTSTIGTSDDFSNSLNQGLKNSSSTIKEVNEGLIETNRQTALLNASLNTTPSTGGWFSKLGDFLGKNKNGVINAANAIGTTLSMISMGLDKSTRNGEVASGVLGLLGGGASAAAQIISGGPAGWISGGITAISSIVNAMDAFIETAEEKTNRLNAEVKKTSNQALISKNEVQELTEYKDKLDELAKSRDNDADSQAEWLSLNQEIVEKYPSLLKYIDDEGNYIANLSGQYESLLKVKKLAYEQDLLSANSANLNATSDFNTFLGNKDYSSYYKDDDAVKSTGIIEYLNLMNQLDASSAFDIFDTLSQKFRFKAAAGDIFKPVNNASGYFTAQINAFAIDYFLQTQEATIDELKEYVGNRIGKTEGLEVNSGIFDIWKEVTNQFKLMQNAEQANISAILDAQIQAMMSTENLSGNILKQSLKDKAIQDFQEEVKNSKETDLGKIYENWWPNYREELLQGVKDNTIGVLANYSAQIQRESEDIFNNAKNYNLTDYKNKIAKIFNKDSFEDLDAEIQDLFINHYQTISHAYSESTLNIINQALSSVISERPEIKAANTSIADLNTQLQNIPTQLAEKNDKLDTYNSTIANDLNSAQTQISDSLNSLNSFIKGTVEQTATNLSLIADNLFNPQIAELTRAKISAENARDNIQTELDALKEEKQSIDDSISETIDKIDIGAEQSLAIANQNLEEATQKLVELRAKGPTTVSADDFPELRDKVVELDAALTAYRDGGVVSSINDELVSNINEATSLLDDVLDAIFSGNLDEDFSFDTSKLIEAKNVLSESYISELGALIQGYINGDNTLDDVIRKVGEGQTIIEGVKTPLSNIDASKLEQLENELANAQQELETAITNTNLEREKEYNDLLASLEAEAEKWSQIITDFPSIIRAKKFEQTAIDQGKSDILGRKIEETSKELEEANQAVDEYDEKITQTTGSANTIKTLIDNNKNNIIGLVNIAKDFLLNIVTNGISNFSANIQNAITTQKETNISNAEEETKQIEEQIRKQQEALDNIRNQGIENWLNEKFNVAQAGIFEQQLASVSKLNSNSILISYLTFVDQIIGNASNEIKNAFLNGDFSTKQGSQLVIKSLNNLGVDTTLLEPILDNYIINLNTEINTFNDNLASSGEDFQKAILGATKDGLKIKEAQELATKMGKSWTQDFRQIGDKFFYKDALDDIVEAFFPQETRDMIQAAAEEAKQVQESGILELTNNAGKNLLDAITNATRSGNLTFEQIAQELSDANGNFDVKDFSEEQAKQATQLWEKYGEAYLAQYRDGERSFAKYIANLTDADIAEFEAGLKIIEAYVNEAKSSAHVSQSDAISGILKDTITEADLQKYNQAFGNIYNNLDELANFLGLRFNADTQTYERSAKTLEQLKAELLNSNLNSKQRREKQAEIDDAIAEPLRNRTKAIDDIISNTTKDYTDTEINNIINNLGLSTSTAQQAFKDSFVKKDNGYYSVNLDQFMHVAEILGLTLDEQIDTFIDNKINNLASVISDMSSAAEKGVQQSDLDTKTESFNKLFTNGETQWTTDAIFDYNATLQAWVYTQAAISEVISKKKTELEAKNLNDQEVTAALSTITAEITGVSQFTLDVLLNSNTRTAEKFAAAIQQYNQQDNVTKIDSNTLSNIQKGGQIAVDALQSYYKSLNLIATDEEVAKVYRYKADQLINQQKQLETLSVGSIVTEDMAKILRSNGYKADRIEGTDSALITEIGNIANAYHGFLARIQDAAGATTAEINAATASWFTAQDNEKGLLDAISILKSAFGITYQALGETLAKYGYNLQKVINDSQMWGIETNGAGGINITDFSKFANQIGWESGSRDYIDAYSTYIDSLVQYRIAITNNIKTEAENLKNLANGKSINVTWMSSEYGLGEDTVSAIAHKYGLTLHNGILTATDNFVGGFVGNTVINFNQELRDSFALQNIDGQYTEIIKTINESISSMLTTAANELSSYSAFMKVEGTTAQLIAAYSKDWRDELTQYGQITLSSIGEYQRAVLAIYSSTKDAFDEGTISLTAKNSAYANVIKSNNLRNTTAIDFLKNGNGFDLAALQGFADTFGLDLAKMLDQYGQFMDDALFLGLEKLDNNNYRIVNPENFMASLHGLGVKIDETAKDFIDSYITILENSDSVINSKENLIANLIPELDKLSYAQIGQIAKTFDMTVDQVIALLDQNADGSFNGNALLNQLDFNKKNESVKKALIEQYKTLDSTMAQAAMAFISNQDYKELNTAITDYIEGYKSLGKNIAIDDKKLKQYLREGGEKAVKAIEDIYSQSGQQLSASDVTAVYRAQVDKLLAVENNLMATSGSIVDAVTAQIIAKSGGAVHQIGNTGQWLVLSAANLVEAYDNLLKRIKDSGEATLQEINAIAAKKWANVDGEQNAIDALSNAASMTYEAFGDILTTIGVEMTDNLMTALTENGVIKSLGGNKMQISDWQTFASLAGWDDPSSPEYISALQSYNDALIKMNEEAEQAIQNELNSLSDSKQGKWLNLTNFYTEMNQKLEDLQAKYFNGTDAEVWDKATLLSNGIDRVSPLTKLNANLNQYGASFQDGILKYSDNANIYKALGEVRYFGDLMGLSTEYQSAIYDAQQAILSSAVDSIKKGISGGLTSAEAQDLTKTLTGAGFNVPLDFKKTAEGLQLSRDSAVALYQQLEQIDQLQASLVFDDVYNSLTATGEGLENVSQTTAKISEIQRQIANNQEKIDGMSRHPEKYSERIAVLRQENAELEKQLDLLQQIQVRQADNPESYNFMNRDIPDYLKGPENYWNSVGSAYKAMNEASSSGYMEIQDFYNIVNEMSNLASISGQNLEFMGQTISGSAEDAAALIEKGMSALSNIDGSGIKIDLSKLGVDISSGAESMQKGFDDGVKAMAKSQIEMLDAAIAMLEVVVAMEDLKKLDVENQGTLDLSEIFEMKTPDPSDFEGFTKDYSSWAKHVKELAEDNSDLQKALNTITINGHTLDEYIDAAIGTYEQQQEKFEKLGISLEQYQQVINAFYQAMLNGDYNLEHIQESVWEILNKTMPNGLEIDLGNRTIAFNGGYTYSIDWSSPTTQEIIADYAKNNVDEETAKQNIKTAFENYYTGKAGSEEIETVLKIKGLIKVKKDENGKTKYIIDGKEYDDLKSDGAREALVREIAKDKGISEDQVQNAKYDKPSGNLIVTDEKNASLHTIINPDGTVTYEYKGYTATTLQELAEKIAGDNTERLIIETGENPENYDTIYNKQLVKIQTELGIYEGSSVAGVSSDTLTQQEIYQLIADHKQKVQQDVQDAINKGQVGENGEIPVTIDNKTFTIKLNPDSAGGYSIDDTTLVKDAIDQVDPDGLIAKISAGIKDAFSGDTSIADALGTAISQAIEKGLTGSTSDTSDSNNTTGTKTIPLPKINIQPTEIEITGVDSTKASFATGEDNAVKDIPVDSISVKPAELTIAEVTTAVMSADTIIPLESATAQVTDLKVSAANLIPDAGVKELQGMDFSGTTSGLSTIAGKLNAINGATFSNFDTLSGKLATIQGQLDTIVATINQLTDKEINVNLHTTGNNGGSNNGGTTTPTSSGSTSAPTVDFTDMLASLSNAVGAFGDAMTSVQSDLNSISTDSISDAISKIGQAINNVPTGGYAALAVQNLGTAMANIPNIASRVSSLANAMNKIPTGTSTLNIKFKYTTAAANATGNIGAMATGNVAMAAGTRRTLMGELGPELVVSNGRYFIVGQGGAEFVDLASDAIVFNHKQTKRLIEQGAINSRGKPYISENAALAYAKGHNPLTGMAKVVPEGNEQIGTGNGSSTNTTIIKYQKIASVTTDPTEHSFRLYSFAKGNMAGPAMASAKAALAALKEIRAMWQAMLDSSPKNLGALAGRGGGGRGKGGGGKNGSGDGSDSGGEGEEATPFQLTAATAEIQRWYNLLRQIERLEKDITYQEQLQNNLLADQADNGELIYQSYKTELDFLDEEIVKQKQLLELQKSWLEARIADLTNPETSVLARIFTYDPEKRLLQYRGDGTPGSGVGLDILEQLNRRDINGQGLDHAANSEEQLKYLDDLGVDLSMLTYKDDGTRIAEFDATGKLMDAATHEWLEGEELDSARTEMVERFFELVESEMDEIDSLQESIEDTEKSILEEEAKANEILQKLIDNQLEIEQSVLKAITDREQSVIDALEDEKDAINDAANKFVDGLSEQLNREREMYNQNNQNEELIRLQRQLAILQRAGGSAAQIKNLQDQITAKQRDAYFDAQQNQIDAIKDASDKEIERLDAQLNIMTETLEYQKEHGLLWNEVYSVMNDSKNAILNFISTFDEAFKPISTLDFDQKLIELGDKIGQWIAYRDDTNTAINNNKPTLIAHNATQGWDTFTAAYSDAYSDVWNQEYSNIKAAYEDELAKTGDTNAADAAALKYLWDKTGRALPLIDAGGSALPVQKTTYSSVTGHAKPKETSSSGGGVGGGDVDYDPPRLPSDDGDDDQTVVQPSNSTAWSGKVNVSDHLLLRSGPGTSYSTIGRYENGESLSGNGVQDGWYFTGSGWVNGAYLNLGTTNSSTTDPYIPSSETPPATTNNAVGYATKDTGFKIFSEKNQNSTQIGTIPKNTQFDVLIYGGTGGDWHKVKYKDKEGWVVGKLTTYTKYKSGGLVDFTGPAWVDGSKTRPEGILNADETEFFRNDFMHSAHLLTSVMHDLDILVDDMSDTSRYNGIGSTESINIENAQVIMNVDSIASDYDAQRAGEQALEQMLKIARKSGTLSLTRR